MGKGIALRDPTDARRAVQRIVSKIFREGTEVEHAGKVANLLQVFLKAWELDKISDIEKRLTALEAEQVRMRSD